MAKEHLQNLQTYYGTEEKHPHKAQAIYNGHPLSKLNLVLYKRPCSIWETVVEAAQLSGRKRAWRETQKMQEQGVLQTTTTMVM